MFVIKCLVFSLSDVWAWSGVIGIAGIEEVLKALDVFKVDGKGGDLCQQRPQLPHRQDAAVGGAVGGVMGRGV